MVCWGVCLPLGKESQLTSVSEKVLETCKNELLSTEEPISQLERDIATAQEAALEGAEMESLNNAPHTPMSGTINDDSNQGMKGLTFSRYVVHLDNLFASFVQVNGCENFH